MIQRVVFFFISISLIAGVFTNCQDSQAQTKVEVAEIYTISGKVDSLAEDRQVILASFDPIAQKSTALDTTEIADDGSYQLDFSFQHPDLYKVSFPDRQTVMLAIDQGQKAIQLDVEGKRKGYVKLDGSVDSEKLQGYEAFRAESLARLVSPTYADMRAAKGNAMEEVAAVEAYGQASEMHRKELIDYAVKHMQGSVALYGTVLRWTGDAEIPNLEELVGSLKSKAPNIPMVQVMEDKINRFKKVAIGAQAPFFELPDSLGNNLTIDDLKGKYTLLDFWASWCGPCLLQVPDLKIAHDNYQEQGFEIVGISVDKKGKRWKKAIHKYEMNWPHVSDLKGWESKVAADYNVTFIPFNMLIDAEGKIIGKNLHSKALQEKLAGLFE